MLRGAGGLAVVGCAGLGLGASGNVVDLFFVVECPADDLPCAGEPAA